MELVILLIGMILAFILGAYVRQPFPLRRREDIPTITLHNDKGVNLGPIKVEKSDGEQQAELKRMRQIKNMWDYVGVDQTGKGEDDRE